MSNKENFAPYTSPGNILLILGRIKKGWVPNQIDRGEMIRAGITDGNANRTIAALEYFGLLNEDGKTTDTWKAIATSTSNDYPKVLEGILKNAYPTIFELHPNPAEATDIEIADAFKKSEPYAQQGRMVSLFRGLCQEAGLIPGEPLTRERKTSQKPASQKNNSKDASIQQQETEIQKYKTPAPPEKMSSSLVWYNNLGTLMSRLPDPENAHWSLDEKERWLHALQAMLDLLITEDD
jgi:hypothetical protein